MDKPIYQAVPLNGRSFLQKLFNQQPPDNAVRELNNLLAVIPVAQLSRADIVAVEKSYGVNLSKEYPLNLEEFYAVYLASCPGDAAALQHLQNVLGLSAETVTKLRSMIGEAIYRNAFAAAINGRRLPQPQKDALSRLRTTWQLPAAITEKVALELSQQHIDRFLASIKERARCSPTDEQELIAMVASLGGHLNKDSLDLVAVYKRYWAIENAALEPVYTEVPMQKGEACYLAVRSAGWYEGTKMVDSGTCCLTNKRILLAGVQKNTNVRLEKIIRAERGRQGIQLYKDAGKNPVIALPQKQEEFLLLLNRLLKERL